MVFLYNYIRFDITVFTENIGSWYPGYKIVVKDSDIGKYCIIMRRGAYPNSSYTFTIPGTNSGLRLDGTTYGYVISVIEEGVATTIGGPGRWDVDRVGLAFYTKDNQLYILPITESTFEYVQSVPSMIVGSGTFSDSSVASSSAPCIVPPNTKLYSYIIGDHISHIINYASIEGGTISGLSYGYDGDTVTLTVTPDTGYILSGSPVVYKTASMDGVVVTKVSDTTYTFVMPNTDVTVTGIFARAYSVSIACSPSTAASITRTPSSELIQPGITVSFTVTPGSDWQISTMDFSQDANVQWDPSTLTGRFTMPERLVYGTIYLSNRLDPNAGGGTSEPEVPSGDFDNDSDVIHIPVRADRGVVNVTAGKGLISLWNPTNAEIADIGNYLYSTDWADALYQGFRDFFVKPLESAISLHVLPIVPSRGNTKLNVKFGPHNSGVSAYPVTNQYKTVDLGTLEIKPYWDSYLDYNPYTKIQIYLPYVGTQDIDTDIVMGKTLGIRYTFDVITGACIAFLYTMENSTPSIFAEFIGESAMQIPLCSSDYSRVIGGIIQAAATVATGRMVTGAAMKSSNELVSSKQIELEQASNRLDSANRKRPRTPESKAAKQSAIESATIDKANAESGLAMAQAKAGRTQASMYAAELRAVPYEVGSVIGGKVTTTISGSVAGGAGFLGSQTPYLIIKRPKQSLPDGYKKYVGYPSNIYSILGNLSGYTRIEQADLQGIPCTDAELAMIYKALKEGVYL